MNLFINATENEISISVNDEQFSNTPSSIVVTDVEIVICVNDLHPTKAEFPILVTDGGIEIFFNEKQFLKQLFVK